MQKQTLKIAVGGVIVLVVGIGAWKLREDSRNRKAAKIYQQLQNLLSGARGQLQWEKAFDIHYPKQIQKDPDKVLLVLKPQVARGYAEKIHSAWVSWYLGGDDEAKVYSVFRMLTDKVQISQVAKAYQEQYDKHLIEVLKERFSSSEIGTLLSIVKSKPNYSYA